MTEEHTGLLADPHIWVLFSTLIFAALLWWKGRQPLLKMLDSRTDRIKAELEEASRLKAEAQALLDDYRSKEADAARTAKEIIDNAKKAAVQMQKDAAQKTEESLKRRETLLLERIARAEASAVQEIRNQAADIAAKAAETLLTDAMEKRGAKLINEAIEELPQRLN